MKSILKWIVRIFGVVVVIAVIVGLWKREEIGRLKAVQSLFTEEKIVGNFSNMSAAFLSKEIPISGEVSPLVFSRLMEMPNGFGKFLKERTVTSVLVLKDGEIRHEDYLQGTKEDDLRISWSIAKSYLSALFGIILDEGTIESIDDKVTKYVPTLEGTAYSDATLKNIIQMSTGVVFDEDYLDYDSDINRMGRILALGGEMDEFAAGLSETEAAPGERWKYVSIDTHILAMAIRAATGRSLPDLLSEKLIGPLGYEQQPYYLTDGEGVAFALGGLNITTRDYARLGQMFLQDGEWQGQQIVPKDWVRVSTTPSAKTNPGDYQYGYHWWMPRDATDGEFLARGIYGQYIYINRPENVVIVLTSADRKFREDGVSDQNINMFRAITASFTP